MIWATYENSPNYIYLYTHVGQVQHVAAVCMKNDELAYWHDGLPHNEWQDAPDTINGVEELKSWVLALWRMR